ncbi:MAG: hypothetical protein R3293_08110, partial [Candidatus Promineifilaceae bacterium]|nr:hypothetical protein [Candidatus Promineifilaceae bacterium]
TWAIQEPARQLGVDMEESVLTAMVADVHGQPGALPLLQYALTELFDERQDHMMTFQAYQALGGVSGALALRAEELYKGLNAADQEAARQLFLRLVTLGEGTEDTRRRVLLTELGAIQTSEVSETSEVTNVLDAFGRFRLLTFDHDPVTREPTVEVAHEALLREWPRLREWLSQSRDDVRLQRLLAAAATEWALAGKDAGYLLRGSRLDLFENWAEESDLALTAEERNFLEASIIARREREAEEEARRQQELETAQKLAATEKARAEEQAQAAGRLRQRALFLTGALVIAAILAIAAIFFASQSNVNAMTAAAEADQRATAQVVAEEEAQSRATAQALAEANESEALAQQATAEAEADFRATAEAQAAADRDAALQAQSEAELQTALTTSRELALASSTNLDQDPELSILLALQALEVQHTNQAETALHEAVRTSRLRSVFFPHDNGTKEAVFSPDGRRLATAGKDGLAKVLDVESGQELAVFTGHQEDWVFDPDDNYVETIEFVPDGSRVASMGENGMLRIWDAESGEELLAINADFDVDFFEGGGFAGGIAFTPDSARMARGFGDGSARVWDTTTGEEIITVKGHGVEPTIEDNYGVSNVEFSPDGSRLVTTGMDAEPKAIVWDINTGEQLTTLDRNASSISHARFSPDGALIATTETSSTSHIWDAATGELLQSFEHGRDGIRFTPDGAALATAGTDGSVRIWDIASGEEIITLAGHPGGISSIDISPDGTQAVTVDGNGNIRISDLGLAHESFTYDVGYLFLTKVIYSPDVTRLATLGGRDGTAHIWDASNGQKLLTLEGHQEWVGDIIYSSDGSLLATASDDGTARLWDAETGESLQIFAGHDDWVNMVALNPDDTLLATAGQDRKVIIWDIASGEIVHTLEPFEDSIWSIRFSPDGSRLATGINHLDPRVRIWDVDSGQEILALTGHEHWVNDVVFTPDGSRILTTSGDGTARIWDADSGEELLFMTAPSEMRSGDISPDGQLIVTGEVGGHIKLWDAATGNRLITLIENAGGSITHVEFSPNGKRVLANINRRGGNNGLVMEFILPLDELLGLAHSKVTRSLTEEECRQYLHVDSCPN